jgi:hypothetical protein
MVRLLLLGILLLAGCAKEIGDDPPSVGGSASDAGGNEMDAGNPFGNSGDSDRDDIPDEAIARDAAVTADAFFINDPPPPYCGPDGEMSSAEPPGGTPECPDDKNREGCPCPEEGMEADCWPGKRSNRNHGICSDGTTTCNRTDEFGLRWGPCKDYVLPKEGYTNGEEACGCFSNGTWDIENVAPCITAQSVGDFVYSAKLDGMGGIDCNQENPGPTPYPGNWSNSTLRVDCAGQFTLCFTIKAGDANNRKASDCVLAEKCIDVWYPEEGVEQELEPLAHWASDDEECGKVFRERSGYGEMTVMGTTVECDSIEDNGDPLLILITDYCPPPAPGEEQTCGTGSAGDF